ncbi:MAG: hypothetical protein K9L68_02445 [Spirochaetales bacterium]|nr:hypothetical protein [Spirochaetales bacterium]MCF7937436.1 hypothetical protein [Spirochaetales bacterium]
MRVSGTGSLQIRAPVPEHLQNGQMVNVRVNRMVGSGKWSVHFAGKEFRARTDLRLMPGALYRARVRIQGKSFILTLQDTERNALRTLTSGFNVPFNTRTENLVHAFLGHELPLREELFFSAYRLLSSSGREDKRSAGLLAALLRSGILPDERSLSDLIRALEEQPGRQDSRQENSANSGHDGGKQQKKRHSGTQHQEASDEACEVPDRIAPEIRIGSGESGDPLQIANQLAAERDGWIIVPFRSQIEKMELAGSVRIHRREGMDDIVVFEIRDGEDSWIFRLDHAIKGEDTMRLFADISRQNVHSGTAFTKLAEELKQLAVRMEAVPGDLREVDGFAVKTQKGTLHGVDEVV